jgi:hypothetical protein
VRGTVAGITRDTLTVRTMSGDVLPVMLTAGTHYSEVLKSNLDQVNPGSYVGAATKSSGDESAGCARGRGVSAVDARRR